MSNYKFKTTNIKGKAYVEVNERIKYFRTSPDYAGWGLSTDLVNLTDDACVIKATITNAEGVIVASGFAQEDKSSSYINKTSYVENCETSAWGRALANLGIGIDTSIASSNEVNIAIAKQNSPTPSKSKEAIKPEFKEMTNDIMENMIKAVADGKIDVVEKALIKYVVSDDVRKQILGA